MQIYRKEIGVNFNESLLENFKLITFLCKIEIYYSEKGTTTGETKKVYVNCAEICVVEGLGVTSNISPKISSSRPHHRRALIITRVFNLIAFKFTTKVPQFLTAMNHIEFGHFFVCSADKLNHKNLKI